MTRTTLIFQNKARLLAVMLILGGASVHALSVKAAEVVIEEPIPTDASTFYYTIGGGTPLPKPAAFNRTADIRASYRLGFGYSCGSFDPFDNVEAMVDQVLNKVRRLPSQFVGAVQAGIAALPGYLLNKANPALYETVTKLMDDSFELFNASFKSCQQMEREIARKENPYQEFTQVAIANNWRTVIGAGSGVTIDEIEQTVTEEGPRNGIDFVDGAQRGGENQPPIRVNYDIAITGYNSLLGRSSNLLDESAPPDPTVSLPDGSTMTIPMVRMFSSPRVAADWLVDIVGEHEVRLYSGGDGEAEITSVAGRGLVPEVEEHTYKIRQALEKAVLQNDYADLNEYRDTMQVGFLLVDAIRAAHAFEQSIMMDRLAAELAVNYVQNKTNMIKRMLYAGIREANLGMSEAAAPIEKQIRKRTIPDLDAALAEIHAALDLKLKTLARTTSQILRHGDYMSTRRSRAGGVPTVDENPLVDGAVQR